ncbi:MAG: CHRD domain-containing protein, partial [Actinomycetota bacterium]|nr:CHRD domain-containing protein [Actinomycetota bacterium]
PFDLPAATGDDGGGGELMSRQGEQFDPAGGDRALTPADDADRQAGDGPADGTGSGGDDEATPDSTVTDDRSQRRAGPRPGAAVGGGATTVPSAPEPTPAWDPPSEAAGPPPGGRTYTATLSGATGPARPGDPDGTGRASVTVHSGRSLLCVALTTSGIAPATSVHLHRASAPSADPVVTFPAPAGDGRRECVPVDGEVLRRVRTDPGGHYVEVHNDEFPDGAVRGFLAP